MIGLGRAMVGVIAFVATASAQNSVQWTTNYYHVTGATVRDIHQSLRLARPWKSESQHDGLTDWRVNWRFNVAPSGNGCRYTSFSTTTVITITLPRWHAPTNATDDIKAEWQRYITALGQHEAGHAQFALHAAADMHKQLKTTGEAPDCDTLRSRLTSMCQSTLTSYRQREREYDERTRHGATQGAVLRGRSRGGPDRPSQ